MSIHWIGFAGTGLVIAAYLPQITHLITEHCSAGLSFHAFCMWSVASVLLLTYAVATGDPVFVALQSYQLAATGLICFFSKRYEDDRCEDHGGNALNSAESRWSGWKSRLSRPGRSLGRVL